jgi:dihydrofolate reductase
LFKEIAAKHKRVLVESGPSLLNQFLDERLIDTVFLSIVHRTENCTCALASLDDPKLIEAMARSLLRIPARARATSMISGRTVLTRFDCGEP